MKEQKQRRNLKSPDYRLHVADGTRLESSSSHYIIEHVIGQGAFAKVARCLKVDTNQRVAVRITDKRNSTQAQEEENVLKMLLAFDPDRFNFVKWETSFFYKGHLCQEFELLDCSLSQFLKRKQSLCLREIRPIVQQLATALNVLKSLGIVHTDLHPGNIMLVDHIWKPLKVKIIDFGSANLASHLQPGSYITTRWYRAPDVMLGLPCNEAIDTWSLGCITAEMFLGSPLYPGASEYEMLWTLNQTQGPIPWYVLPSGVKTDMFYQRTGPHGWRLQTPEEFGIIPMNRCAISCLDDLKKHQQRQASSLSGVDAMAEEADLDCFVELVKQLLNLDPGDRIIPCQVLGHSFLTMGHLKGPLEFSAYVQSSSHLMSICNPQGLSTSRQPPSNTHPSQFHQSPSQVHMSSPNPPAKSPTHKNQVSNPQDVEMLCSPEPSTSQSVLKNPSQIHMSWGSLHNPQSPNKIRPLTPYPRHKNLKSSPEDIEMSGSPEPSTSQSFLQNQTSDSKLPSQIQMTRGLVHNPQAPIKIRPSTPYPRHKNLTSSPEDIEMSYSPEPSTSQSFLNPQTSNQHRPIKIRRCTPHPLTKNQMSNPQPLSKTPQSLQIAVTPNQSTKNEAPSVQSPTHTSPQKPSLKRKRVDSPPNNKRSNSPPRKRRRICEEKTSRKRRYSQISMGPSEISGSPPRKRRRISETGSTPQPPTDDNTSPQKPSLKRKRVDSPPNNKRSNSPPRKRRRICEEKTSPKRQYSQISMGPTEIPSNSDSPPKKKKEDL